MCVSETRITPNRKPANNQASAEYNTSSEVGIPMLRPQMNEIINVGHGHQSYTWIHVIKMLHSHQEYTVDLCVRRLRLGHSHVTYKVDLCVNTNHKYSSTTWPKR
jgi:hypothetical protein